MEKFEELKEFISEHKYLFMIGGISLILLVGLLIFYNYNYEDKDNEVLVNDLLVENDDIEVEDNCLVKVDIKGEVVSPGLYEVDCESRVQDVIDLALGLTDKADTSVLNLGKKVLDEMVIIVYSKDEVNNFNKVKQEEVKVITECINKTEIKNDACIDNSSLNNSLTDSNGIITDTPVNVLISLNKATKEELMTLSGIGESKANSIINYRNENGGFKTLEEVKNVKGIGDSIFEKIKDSITL